MSLVAGIGLSYFPFDLLRHGRRAFPSHLNAKAASEAAALYDLERYQFRRQLLEYYLRADQCDFIFGHFPFSKSSYMNHKDKWNFVTCLRDPVERWYSEYFWNRYKNHDYKKTDLDIENYLDTEEGRTYTRSYVNFLTQTPNPHSEPKQSEISEAIENLSCFKVIGLLEDLNSFQNNMKKHFGRKPIILKRNKSPAPDKLHTKPDPNSDFHKKLLSLLSADIEIYNAAKARQL